MRPKVSARSCHHSLLITRNLAAVTALALLLVMAQPLSAQSLSWLSGIGGGRGENFHPPYRLHQDPWVNFVLASANMYAISTYPADNGSAIVPLYTDYDAGGTYGTPDSITNITVDDDDPDAAHGTSSYQ